MTELSDSFESATLDYRPAKPDHVANTIRDAESAISKYVEELQARIVKAEAYTEDVAIAADFVRAFPALAGDSDWEWDRPLRIALSLDPNSVNALMINFDALRLTDLTEPLRWLAQRLGAYTIDDYPELQRRAYVFANDGRPVRFQVFLHKDGALCKFVKTGVKEEPVYTLMCDEAEVPS